MHIGWLFLQHGILLNYITGKHSPSITEVLRQTCELNDSATTAHESVKVAEEGLQGRAVGLIKELGLEALVPQCNLTSQWPPIVFLHGTADTDVPFLESKHMFMLVEKQGVPAKLLTAADQEHSFDYAEDAEEKWAREFEEAIEFVDKHTRVGL